MPNLKPSLLHICCQALRSHVHHQSRHFRLVKARATRTTKHLGPWQAIREGTELNKESEIIPQKWPRFYVSRLSRKTKAKNNDLQAGRRRAFLEQAQLRKASFDAEKAERDVHGELLQESRLSEPSPGTFFNSNFVRASSYKRLALEQATEAPQQHDNSSIGSDVSEISLRKPIASKHQQRDRPPGRPKLSLFEELFPDEVKEPLTKVVSPVRPELSLFEELFPEEAEKNETKESADDTKVPALPKLVLPGIDVGDGGFEDGYVKRRKAEEETAKIASTDAYRHWNLAILVLQVASPSLVESDFRRIAPKGQHLRDWVGPGDIFRVIPAREPTTLRQETRYFLVFPNPAYARAYQNHAVRLHSLAKTHTPTSIESPMAPPKGMIVQGEDVHDLLQNYTLLPPSQKMKLISLFPPYSIGVKRLLERRGYPELMTPKDKTGRSVLFWVEGFVPTLLQVKQMIHRDGRARGLIWSLLDGKDSIQQLEPDANSDATAENENRMETERQANHSPAVGDYLRRTLIRWIIAFEDENEARRFVRAWHLRPFASAFNERKPKGDVQPLVHAEVMW